MNKIILAVVIVVIGVAGYFAFVNKSPQVVQQTSTPTPTKTAQATKSPTATPNPTSNWKTYTNTQYGFEIKYPTSWQVSSPSPNQIVHLVDKTTPVVPDTDVTVNGVSIVVTSGPTKGSPTTVSGKNALVTGWEKGFADAFWKEIFMLSNPGIHITLSALSSDGQTLENQILSTFKFTK